MLDVNIPQTGTIWGSHHALPAEPLPARGGGVLEGTTKAPGTPPTDASHQGNCWIVSTRSEEPETTGRRPPVTGGNHNSARGTNPLTGWERAQTPRTNNSYVFACGGGEHEFQSLFASSSLEEEGGGASCARASSSGAPGCPAWSSNTGAKEQTGRGKEGRRDGAKGGPTKRRRHDGTPPGSALQTLLLVPSSSQPE